MHCIVLLLFPFYITSTSAASLLTTFTGGNNADGNMFDLCARSTTLEILSFNINCELAGSASIEIYAATNPSQSYAAIKDSSTWWTLIHQQTVTCNAMGWETVLNSFNLAAAIINSGDCRGFYVTRSDAENLAYTNGGTLGTIYASNTDIRFKEGIGKMYPFGDEFSPRVWNGRIYYNLVTPSRDPTTFAPSTFPTTAPTIPSVAPSGSPSRIPSISPTTISPTTIPTTIPTTTPTRVPTLSTGVPSFSTADPSITPTIIPSNSPTNNPTTSPTIPRSGESVPETSMSVKQTGDVHRLSNEDSGDTVTVVFVVLGIVVAVLICIGIAIYVLRHKKIKDSEKINGNIGESAQNGEKYRSHHELTSISRNLSQPGSESLHDVVCDVTENHYKTSYRSDIDIVGHINQTNFDTGGMVSNIMLPAMPPVIPAIIDTDIGPDVNDDSSTSTESQEFVTDFGETAGVPVTPGDDNDK